MAIWMLIGGQDLPTFTTLPNDETTVQLGETVTLPCSATGNPIPKIDAWLFNGLQINLQSGRHSLRATGELVIFRADKSDDGKYQCVAKSTVGGVVSPKKRLYIAYFEKLFKSNTLEQIGKQENEYLIAKVPEIQCQPKRHTKFLWFKNGSPIRQSETLQVSVDGNLYLSHLQTSDQGTYKLTVENTFLSSRGKEYARQDVREFQITIQGTTYPTKPSVIYITPHVHSGEKKTEKVILECFVTGMVSGFTEVVWYKVDKYGRSPKVVNTDTRHIKQLQGRRLEIKNPTYSDDNGFYRCVPRYGLTDFTNQAKVVNVIVSSIPEFNTKANKFQAYTDGSTALHCSAQGYPSVNMSWYRNGIPLQDTHQSHDILANNTVHLKKLNWQDNGVFQCAAENYAGIFFLNLQLDVRNISAKILTDLKKYYIHFDKVGEIPCVTIGAPKPVITWSRNSQRIQLSSSKYNINENGSLVIQNAEAADEGPYTCTANNYINTDYKTTTVYVVQPTKISKFPPKEFSVIRGDSPLLDCEVEHDKRVNYTREWRVVNLPVDTSKKRYVVEPSGGLRINFVDFDDTNLDFSCHIFAEDGNYSATTVLVLEKPPFQPSSPRVVGVAKATSLDLVWDAPDDGGSPILNYALEMKNYTQTVYTKIAEILAPSTTYTVKNLQPGSKYKFKVAARNKYGYGESSAEIEKWLETKTTEPSGAPLDFQSVDAGTDFIIMQWKPPLKQNQNGELTGYSIQYRVAGYGGTNSFTVRKLDSLVTEYRMDGLPLFTKFEVQVSARNKVGRGPWTYSIFIETLQGRPSAPPTNLGVSVVNSTTVRVSFTSPRQQLWNGKLTRIVALYWPPGRPQDQQIYETKYDTSNINKQTFYLPHLDADKEYMLSVQVKTTGGPSPGSEKVIFKTTEGKPDSVRDLQVSNTYSDAFTVTWKVPLKSNGKLTEYIVRYRIFSAPTWQKISEVGTALGAVVKNLQPLTKYEVEVAASTSAGLGTWEKRSATTIEKPELPHAPSDLKAYNVWGNVISLGWSPGYSGRAVILYYQIQYNNETDYHQDPRRAIWRDIKNITRILENPSNITHLRPNTIYRFRMRAHNRVGPSKHWSNVSIDISTGEGIPTAAPTDIIATAPARQTLEIRWKPPSRGSWNSDSVKYQFLIKPKGQDPKKDNEDQYHQLSDSTATLHRASGLQMFTVYNITIRLFNERGYGNWSVPIFKSTSEDYPSGYPINIRTVVKSSSSVLVKWGPVPQHQRNGIITGYKVFYQLKGFVRTELFKDFPGNTTYSGLITGLHGFTDYEFRLLAYTKVGGTLKSPPTTAKTFKGKPGKPTNVRFTEVNYQFIELEWDPPLRPNGRISRYRVYYRQNVTGATWVSVPVSIYSPRSARVNALIFNRYYEFKIQATNSIDWGVSAIERVLVTSVRETPESPVILAIPSTSIRHTSVIVEWRPRFDGNSPIRAFNLQYNKALSGWRTYRYGIPPVENIDDTLNKLEVLHMEPGTKYQFRVRAINDVGPSAWSENSVQIQTLQREQYGAPLDVRVIAKTPSTITIAWKRPEIVDLSSPIAGYRIEYQWLQSVGGPLSINTDRNTFEYTLKGLQVFSLYEIRIAVFNQLGSGTWTQRYKWRTGESAPLIAPTNVKVIQQGKSMVRVTWEPPDEHSVNGYVLGYKIESRLLGTGKRRRRRSTNAKSNFAEYIRSRSRRGLVPVCTSFPEVTTSLAGPYSTEVTLKNLKRYTRYDFTVRVYNSFADGPKSYPPIRLTTPQDVPGPPYILSDRQYTDLIEVDFAEPCEPNGQILAYRVRFQEFGQRFADPIDYGANRRRIRITGLKQQTKYILELFAKTSLGYGQKATIEFYTKGPPVLPGRPGTPQVHENKPGFLILKWHEGANGNAPITQFKLQYRKDNGGVVPFRDIKPDEVRYDGATVVYTPFTLKADGSYRFRVQSTTKMGISPWSDWSQPIKPVSAAISSKPIIEEIWFIFVLIIIFIILLIITIVCCWKCQRGKVKYKPQGNAYKMSSFEMAMVNNPNNRGDGATSRLLPSNNGSKAPSIANSSMRKSVAKTASSDSLSDPMIATGSHSNQRPGGSIASHYNNDPYHKNWRDSLDKKTKKEILSEYGKRKHSQHSIDSLEEKKKMDPIYDRAASRPRPGRKDISELRNLARSQPELLRDENPYNFNPHQQQRYQQPKRPGKRPIDHELARSVPDLNRQNSSSGQESQVTRQPSFLRATGGDSEDNDNESLHEVFAREKTKRELALELDDKMDDYYTNSAPPPYDYNAAPPAYSPSDISDSDYMRKSGGAYNSDYGRSAPAMPSNRSYKPQERGYYNPGREYQQRVYQPSPSSRFPPRYPPDMDRSDGKYFPPPPSSSEAPASPYASSSDHQFSLNGRSFSPPQNAYIDGDELDDPDGDMTLV